MGGPGLTIVSSAGSAEGLRLGVSPGLTIWMAIIEVHIGTTGTIVKLKCRTRVCVVCFPLIEAKKKDLPCVLVFSRLFPLSLIHSCPSQFDFSSRAFVSFRSCVCFVGGKWHGVAVWDGFRWG